MSEEQSTTDTPEEAEHIRNLREKAKAGDAAAAKASELERKVAVLEAGINTSTPLGQMFLKSYDGELESEAIKTAAQAVGLIEGQADPEPQPGEPGTAEAEYQNTRDVLSTGQPATIEDAPKVAPDMAYKAYTDARKNGMRAEDAQMVGFRTLLEQAAQGNQSAIFSPSDWARQQAEFGSANA